MKKTNNYIVNFILLITMIGLTYACQKLDFSHVTKCDIVQVVPKSPTSVEVQINVFDLSSDPHPDHGICYDTTNTYPTIGDNIVSLGSISAISKKNHTLTGLIPGTTYYFRAFVMNGSEVVYSFQALAEATESVNVPTVTTAPVTNITATSAFTGGNVTNNGNATVTARGVCWSTSNNPTIAGSHTTDGSGNGEFTSEITGLSSGTTYYVRAYATNSAGTGYGNEISFTTYATITDTDGNTYTIVTIGNQVWMRENLKTTKYSDGTAIPDITGNSAWAGLSTPAYCWYNNDQNTYGNVYGALYNWYAVNTGKLCPTGWHVPADAEWTTLTDYLGGASVAGGKLKEADTAHWRSPNTGATNSSGFTALPGGYRVSNGSFLNIGDCGYWWGSTENGTDGAWGRGMYYSDGDVFRGSSNKYFGFSVRCIKDDATTLPTVTTADVNNISSNGATCGGNVTAGGSASVTARGVCWSTSQNPTIANSHTSDGSGTGAFTSNITGLSLNTTYYVRAYATNIAGTAYGSQVSFTTLNANQMSDIDGNIYNTVTIGTQVWMKENLKVTHFNDGTAINYVTGNSSWASTSTHAYCWYNNYSSSGSTYGALYNYYAVVDTRKLCPVGWHVPSDQDFKILEMALGMTEAEANGVGYRGTDEGGKMKEAGTTHWLSPNTGATNASNFTALPGGFRGYSDGLFYGQGENANFWTATMAFDPAVIYRELFNNSSQVYWNYHQRNYGYSVRCVKD